MGCISSTTNADVVRAHGTGRSAFPLSKPTDAQRRSGSGNKAQGTAGVAHHPQSRNAPRDSGTGGSGGTGGSNGVVKAGSSLSSDENSRHVQRLLASLSLLQSLPSLYPWYIAQPPLPHVQLSYCQHMWQSIRLGSHELYARVREADPACTPTLVFFEVFSADLLARCPALHVHLFGSAPLTHHNKPSLSSKLCSLVQTTLSSFAAPHTHRKPKRSQNGERHNHSGVFDSVSDCGSEEASTSERASAAAASSNSQRAERAERAEQNARERERDGAAAAERKQRMASLWRLFNSAGINCEALGPFFTAIQNALCQCFGADWTQPSAQAWGALCSSVIEQMIGVETTGAGAPTMTAAPTGSGSSPDRNANGQSNASGQTLQQPHTGLSVMASPRSHTQSAGGAADTTDTVSRTHTTHVAATHSSKGSGSAPLKSTGHKQRLDLNSTVSRSGAGYSSDAYSPRRGVGAVGSPTTAGRTLNPASSAYAPGAATLSLPLAQSYTGPLASAHQQPLSLSIASPFSQAHAAGPLSGGSTAPSTTGTPVRRLPSGLTSLAAAATHSNGHAPAGANTVQSVSLGLTPMIHLPGQTPSPSTPAVAGAASTMAAEADGVCRVTSGGSGDADSDDEFDALTAEAVAAQMADPATLEAMRATAQLDPAQELARFAFHPKPPQKPRVVYMSGLELPPASIDPNAPQSVALARAYAVNGRSLFGRSRYSHAPAPAGATASELTALALLTATNASAAAARAAAAAAAASAASASVSASTTVSLPPIAVADSASAYAPLPSQSQAQSQFSLASASAASSSSSAANANALNNVSPHSHYSQSLFSSASGVASSQSHGQSFPHHSTHLPALPRQSLPHVHPHTHVSSHSSAHNLSLLSSLSSQALVSRGSILGALRSHPNHSAHNIANSSAVSVSAY